MRLFFFDLTNKKGVSFRIEVTKRTDFPIDAGGPLDPQKPELVQLSPVVTPGHALDGNEPNQHAVGPGSFMLPCWNRLCGESFFPRDLKAHWLVTHLSGHSIEPLAGWRGCSECHQFFNDGSELRKHAKSEQHSSYHCECGTRFERLGSFYRHVHSYLPSSRYECPGCRRRKAFRRRDHLIQHIRGYHRLNAEELLAGLDLRKTPVTIPSCPHKDCENSDAASGSAFEKRSDYTKHMKDVHDKAAFPCPYPGCDRVRGNGYVQEKALIKHYKAKHPGAPEYTKPGALSNETD